MAGLTARMFASKYGDELAGLILVDSRHPEGTGRVLEQFTAELADDWFGAYNLRMDYLTPYRHPLKATESWDSATSE